MVGQRNIDDVLTTEKEVVQAETKLLLQDLLDQYDTGINITEVKLQNVRPPSQVQDAVDDVVRATVFLTDIEDYHEMNKEYASYFKSAFPARACVGGVELVYGFREEISCIAYKEGK